VFGISLGITFVFFTGILAGHLGLSVQKEMLLYAETFGLVIFVYALGLQVGPGFFSSMRTEGAKLLTPAIGVLLTGTLLAVGLGVVMNIKIWDMSGILCGATTNTPALAAAQQSLEQLDIDGSSAALSCALTYPLGVVGVIFAIIFLRKVFVKPSEIAARAMPATAVKPVDMSERGIESLTRMGDRDVVERASKTRDGAKFTQLYQGVSVLETEEKNERSLMSRLAMFCNGDKEQLMRIFKSSGQFRDEKPNSFYEQMADQSIKFVERIKGDTKPIVPSWGKGKQGLNAKT
jgi:AspT/YidE/YbjL antiporter-like protein